MNRLKISVFIIIILTGIAVTSQFVVKNFTTTSLASIEKIGALADEGNFEQAKKEIDILDNFTKKNEHILALFLKRDNVSIILTNCATFSAYAEKGSETDLHAELDRAAAQINMTGHLFFSFI